MFKKDVLPGPKTKLKSSSQRSLRALVCKTYPLLTPHIDTIIPKKAQLDVVNLKDPRATLYILGSAPLFYQHMSDALIPHLLLVHRYPEFFPRLRVDRGAIRFVISGASLMTPGFVSTGGRVPDGKFVAGKDRGGGGDGGGDGDEDGEDETAQGCAVGVPAGVGKSTMDDSRYFEQPELEVGTVVVVEAEGKENACAIGVLKMSTTQMKSAKKGIAIEGAHYVGDGLWRMKWD